MEPLIAEQEQLQQPADLTLAERLTELVEDYGLDPGLAAQYSADDDGIYQYDGMGSDFRDHLAQERLAGITDLKVAYDFIYGRNVVDAAIDGATRETRRGVMSAAFSKRMGGTVLTAILGQPEGREWAENIEDARDNGLDESTLVRSIALSNSLHYVLQTDWEQGPLNSESRSIIFDLMGVDPTDFGPDATIRDVATYLRDKGLLDLSKETLDARVEKFSAATQVEAAALFLGSLADMKLLRSGSPVKQSRWLAARYRDTLLMDDYDLKIEMFHAMSKTFRDFAYRERHGKMRGLLQAKAKWSFDMAKDLDSFLNNFGQVYGALGYELHPLLQHDDDAPMATVHQLPKREQSEAAEEPAGNIEFLSHFETELQSLHERAAELKKVWRLNSHQRRDRGFSTMYRELVGGFRNFAGEQLLGSMSKQDAQAYIDIAAHLDELASDPEARDLLKKALDDQKSIKDDLELIQLYAKELNVRITNPSITPIQEVTAAITEDWSTFRQIALKTWPGREGLQVIGRLERLLFNIEQPVVDDEMTLEVVKEQLEMAEYLDKIVLPPDATREDVQHALESLGEARTIDLFEWKRLKDLVRLREDFGGTLYRTKDFKKKEQEERPEPITDEELPFEPDQEVRLKGRKQKKLRAIEDDPSFWILTFEFEGDRFVIAESAFSNHATFVICDRLIEGTCLQMLGVGRSQAPSRGAHPVIHSSNAKLSHEDRLKNKVIELHGLAA